MNEIYLYLQSRLEHHESCTPRRCHSACSFSAFDADLAAPLPLFVVDVQRAAVERQRLESLTHIDQAERARQAALAQGDISA